MKSKFMGIHFGFLYYEYGESSLHPHNYIRHTGRFFFTHNYYRDFL